MKDLITVRGFLASDVTIASARNGGTVVARFRLGTTERRFNKEIQEWEDGHTNWFTIFSYRNLAENVVQSLSKGQRVIIVGKLKINYRENEDKTWVNPEIEAEAIGHDLSWGTTLYSRNTNRKQVPAETARLPENTAEEVTVASSAQEPQAGLDAENAPA